MMMHFFGSMKNLTPLCLITVLIFAAPAGAQNPKIKIGAASSPPILDTITPYVALEKGFFKKNGLELALIRQ